MIHLQTLDGHIIGKITNNSLAFELASQQMFSDDLAGYVFQIRYPKNAIHQWFRFKLMGCMIICVNMKKYVLYSYYLYLYIHVYLNCDMIYVGRSKWGYGTPNKWAKHKWVSLGLFHPYIKRR